MNTTGFNFSTRSNANRAAKSKLANGTAPAVDYRIEPRDEGRFAIVWETGLTADAFATGAANTEVAKAGAAANRPVAINRPESLVSESSQPTPIAAQHESENKWPDGTRVLVRKRKSWREAAIVSRVDPRHWRAAFPGGGSGLFKVTDIRTYDTERDVTRPAQPKRAKVGGSQKASRSRYGIDPEAIAAGRLPEKAPVVTSAANRHYQKHFDRLFGLATAGDWDAVRDYKVTGTNSYSKMVARYREDLLALRTASQAAE
jgi:hypothetical protein